MLYNMRWITIDSLEEAERAISQVGADPQGVSAMGGKGISRVIKLEGVPLRIAHILKQEMLSAGGDAAVHRETITNGVRETDILLLGSVKQLRQVAAKLQAQPFGLKQLGEELTNILEHLEGRKVRTLNCRGRLLTLGERTLIMGILNVTPDSFSDGGRFFRLENAIEQAHRLIEEGADILDIGAESTRPGHQEVSTEEEWQRLEGVLRELVPMVNVPISVDTYKAEVAEKALELGVHIINDIWGLQRDPKMAKVAGRYDAPVIVMHNRDNTHYQNLMGEMIQFLRQSIALAESAGLQGDQIIIDPGIGFGKTTEQSLEVMARLSELKVLGHPILLGASRKSMIGNTLNLPVDERLEGTIATSVLGVAAGVDIVRVHDVQANRRAVMMADSIVRAQRGANFHGA